MAVSTALSTVKIVTKDGVVTATTLNRVGPDRIAMMLLRGSIAAHYAGSADDSPLVSRTIKDLLIDPRAED